MKSLLKILYALEQLIAVKNEHRNKNELINSNQDEYLVPFRQGKRWGADREKNIIIPCIYEKTWPFSDSLAKV